MLKIKSHIGDNKGSEQVQCGYNILAPLSYPFLNYRRETFLVTTLSSPARPKERK